MSTVAVLALSNHGSEILNIYKRDWELAVGAHLSLNPSVSVDSDGNVDFTVTYETPVEVARAITTTAKAVALGIAISQIDGPLPFADVAGLAIASVIAARAWWDVFN